MEGQRVDMLHPAAYRLARPSTPLVAAHAGSGAGFEPPREERDDPLSLSLSLSLGKTARGDGAGVEDRLWLPRQHRGQTATSPRVPAAQRALVGWRGERGAARERIREKETTRFAQSAPTTSIFFPGRTALVPRRPLLQLSPASSASSLAYTCPVRTRRVTRAQWVLRPARSIPKRQTCTAASLVVTACAGTASSFVVALLSSGIRSGDQSYHRQPDSHLLHVRIAPIPVLCCCPGSLNSYPPSYFLQVRRMTA